MKKRQLKKAFRKMQARIGLTGHKDLLTKAVLQKRKPAKLTWREKKVLLRVCMWDITRHRMAMKMAYEDVLGEDYESPVECTEAEAKEILNWDKW